ncbi:hypothetical protein [Mycobacterium vicinigordonae]|uniref:Mammalian cell entry protein n=1 Tax=Mycobacterium vicinigordonae TaxID=1719132 RepID=A0A7D6E3P1_9MYCO|nr:hypothetical protein [Mycobacterium vicinigordonae]QLL06143.1 hypothetical protein H0P51_20545 [Mycobacterium vicinigordonae]
MAVNAFAAADELIEREFDVPDTVSASPDGHEDADSASDHEVGRAGIDAPSGMRPALVFGVVAIAALVALIGSLGYRAYEARQVQHQRQAFVQVARQCALNLTTIDYTKVESDVRRIIDSATGSFHDDFEKRSGPFIEVVKQAQAKSEGTIIEAGLESADNGQAQVLVAVNVKTSNAGVAEQEPRAWRMRVSVVKVGGTIKIANVEFVP